MPYRDLLKLGGVSAVLSALFGVISLVLYLVVVGGDRLSEAATSATFFLPSGAQLLAMLLLAVGLVALYARQAEAFGALGLVGFFVALVGTVMVAGALWSQVFVVPRLAETAPEVVNSGTGSVLAGFLLSFLLFGLGWVVFGAATLRARVFPRWAVVLLIIGAVVAILPIPSRALVLQLAAACLGFTVLAERGAADGRSSRAN